MKALTVLLGVLLAAGFAPSAWADSSGTRAVQEYVTADFMSREHYRQNVQCFIWESKVEGGRERLYSTARSIMRDQGIRVSKKDVRIGYDRALSILC